MGTNRVIYHVGLEQSLRQRGPRSSEEPPRLDYLLLRKIAREREAPSDSAQTLRRLWPLLPCVSVVDYKSPGHPYRPGHLDRLWGYVHTYFANECNRPRMRADGTALAPGVDGAPDVWTRRDLCAVLVVSERTPSLDEDIESMRLGWEDLGNGYWRVTGGAFALYVVEIDVVGPAEGDDLLHSLGHGKLLSHEARWFWLQLVGTKEAGMSIQDMEGYDELLQRLLDALPPEQVLSRYAPEQRLAGLDRDHQALALPIELLRLLPEQYFRSLSPEVEAELRRRLRQNGH